MYYKSSYFSHFLLTYIFITVFGTSFALKYDATVILLVVHIFIGLHIAKVILIILSKISSKENVVVTNTYFVFLEEIHIFGERKRSLYVL